MERATVIQQLFEQGYLLSPDLLSSSLDLSLLLTLHPHAPDDGKPLVLTKDLVLALQQGKGKDINWLDFEKSRVFHEKKINARSYETFLQVLHEPSILPSVSLENSSLPPPQAPIPQIQSLAPRAEILGDFTSESRKIEIRDFVHFFRSRYEQLRKILQHRQELQNVSSINRILQKSNGDEACVIGLIYDKQVTKTGNILLQVEDPTGILKAIVNKTDPDLFKLAENLCFDEVVGFVGRLHGNLLFVKSLVFPEILNTRKDQKCDEESYACFISDIHVGSKVFLEKEFETFISWLNGEYGDEKQKSIAKKVQYIFMLGDLVDGVGVFPGQEDHLLLKDLRQQYEQLGHLLSRIRPDILLVMCPGNHDSSRAAEPQPPLDKDYAEPLWRLPNILMVTNPSYVRIHQTPSFDGYILLLYHGASFHYFIDNVPMLRQQKARDNPSSIMKFLLQRRHLAPAHTSSTYVPTTKEDVLVISMVPDIFVSGDMHRSDISSYNGVITINCSCWQSKTDYQEKTGNNPDPCKVPIFSLKDRAVFVFDFSKETLT